MAEQGTPGGDERPLTIVLGNEMRGDDGAGPHVADLLKARGIDEVRCAAEPISLLELFPQAGSVIVVDAVAGTEPGRIWHWQRGPERLPAAFRQPASTHLIGLADVLALAGELDRLPGQLSLVGIEGERFELGAGLSESVAQAAGLVAAAIAAELELPVIDVGGASPAHPRSAIDG